MFGITEHICLRRMLTPDVTSSPKDVPQSAITTEDLADIRCSAYVTCTRKSCHTPIRVCRRVFKHCTTGCKGPECRDRFVSLILSRKPRAPAACTNTARCSSPG